LTDHIYDFALGATSESRGPFARSRWSKRRPPSRPWVRSLEWLGAVDWLSSKRRLERKGANG